MLRVRYDMADKRRGQRQMGAVIEMIGFCVKKQFRSVAALRERLAQFVADKMQYD